MSRESCYEKKLSLLDYAFDLLDSSESPQDFTLILYLSNPPSLEQLRAGANSAMKRYPVSSSTIHNRRWLYAAKPSPELPVYTNGKPSLETFVNEPFDLRVQRPVKQILKANGDYEASLVTRFHHAAADGMSAALWLGHQLSVAYGLADPESSPALFSEVPLRASKALVRRSAFAYKGASEPLWTTNYIPSGARHWITINFRATDLQRACRRTHAFTYNDLLAACALEVFRLWNQKHDPQRNQKIGLWLPINIRSQNTAAFGNGTSRIRLYARYARDCSFSDKAREVRKQNSWSIKHGEWVVTEPPLFTKLPRAMVSPLFNGYLRQPTVDLSTGVFTHAERWSGDAAEAFKYVTRIECVGLLHPRQHLAINGATHQGQTWLTFTYDPALLDAPDARALVEMYEQQLALARKELL
ncbi:MAG TPA: hypothetical protein VGW58_01710 [Pyrinomonadaceae bacterium]|nr:hypothetical protein [Pyrinomonadaceae bacterium]